jgi:predicted NBD/HSP70 family sugar kinase
MYLGIDIGGTKTLVASLTNEGLISGTFKFPTPEKYSNFLLELRHGLQNLKTNDYKAIGVGAPGKINRQEGVYLRSPNLSWKNKDLHTDIIRILHAPVVVENDAKLAALSEAMLVKEKYNRVLYVTISTGIGAGVVINQTLDPDFLEIESGQAVFEHHGRMKRWEEFASGKAIVKEFGKRAVDINDQKTWKTIVRYWGPGFSNMIANIQPEIIIIGGSVGAHFVKYKDLLRAEIKKYETPLTPAPKIIGAQRPEEAVIYGCYELARKKYGHIT